MAGSFLFLTQFIRFQDLLFFNALSQKKDIFGLLYNSLKIFPILNYFG